MCLLPSQVLVVVGTDALLWAGWALSYVDRFLQVCFLVSSGSSKKESKWNNRKSRLRPRVLTWCPVLVCTAKGSHLCRALVWRCHRAGGREGSQSPEGTREAQRGPEVNSQGVIYLFAVP